MTRPDGVTVHHAYDTAGRLTTTTLPTGTIARTYDPTTGNLATISGPAGETLTFGYDGTLQTSIALTGSVAGTVTMTYDNDFRVTTKTVNATPAVSFGYDADSLLTSAGAMTLTPNASTGLLSSTTLGVVQDTFRQDSFGDFQSHSASASSTALFAENITLRDALGRIKTKTETVQGTTHQYEYNYDARGQLTDVMIDGVQHSHYAFDGPRGANGNRSSSTIGGVTMAATYDDQDRLLTYGTATYTYRPNGELAAKIDGGQTTTYTYDAIGNLLTVALPGGPTVDYVVDGIGRLVGKKVDGVLVKGFLYENRVRIAGELDGNSNAVSRFIYGNNSNVPEYMIKGGTTYRVVADHLGSVRLVVNTSTGVVVQRIDYDEFGAVVSDSSPGFQPFGFAGGIYDAEAKLVRFGARDYYAAIGRWIGKDPIRFGGGDSNLYRYVGNDPVDFRDPMGKATYTCTVPLKKLSPFKTKYLSHDYICVTQGDHTICGSFNPSGSMFGSPGVNDPADTYDPSICKKTFSDDACTEDCIATFLESPVRPWYDVRKYECHDWTIYLETLCRAECGQ